MIKLGDRVKDKITGFEGIITSMTQYLNGCERVAIQPETIEKGKTIDPEYFDIQQLDLVASDVIEVSKRDTGGPGNVDPGFRNPNCGV